MEEFFKVFNESQIIVMEGEPRSGKTTQIPQFVIYLDLPRNKAKLSPAPSQGVLLLCPPRNVSPRR
ncbi:hypothetical protein J3A83DRAFT_4204199 [Scleroderma citrinum]